MIARRVRRMAVKALREGLADLPSSQRELALSLATRGDHGPTTLPGPPEGPVLVLAPHPDDEAIGPGGAIARHADAGHDVTVLLVTSGGATAGGGADVTAVREEESRRAMRHLGDSVRVAVTGLTDGGLPAEIDDVVTAIEDHCAGVATLYAPSLLDPHPDHHAVARAAGLARLDPSTEVYGYEVWAAGPVNVLLDVTDVFARKQAALAEYRVALETVDYVRSASGLAAYRSASGGMGGRGFAEGFTRMTAADYRAAVTAAG